MSFILDALKKSESERQHQQSTEFANVPSAAPRAAAPRWLWLVGALLAVNLVVVAWLLLRPATPDEVPEQAPAPGAASDLPANGEPARNAAARAGQDPDPQSTGTSPTFEERVDDARRRMPSPVPGAGATSSATATAAQAAAGTPGRTPQAASARASSARLPSLEELQLGGKITLPPLHIDLHVFNEAPDRRFVSINMTQYREADTMSEGPRVREITRDGVVLEYQGQAFVLVK